MDWIDEFLSEMAQIVLNRGGLVEDYFGDGMMACFGIPIRRTTREEIVEDARRAVGAALEMEGALRALNERWKSTDRPTAKIRVGISTGPIVAGSLGSADRLKYSVVGDAVVTAQRLESMEEESTDFDASPARILINQGTRDCLGADVRVEHFGEFKLKGKTEPVSVYRVMDRIADGCDPV
jgi:adenylate cyclase